MTNGFQFSTLDMLTTSPAFAITQGVAYDPPYLYVTPHNDYLIAKVDTRTFTIVDTLDLSQVDKNLVGFLQSFAAGGYLYLSPHYTSTGPVYGSDVVMVDLSNFTPGGCTVMPIFDAGPNLFGIGCFTDGTYGYVNTMNTNPNQMTVTRFGLGKKGFTPASVESVSIPDVDGQPFRSGSGQMLCDANNVYIFGVVQTADGSPKTFDFYLITIPSDNFTAKAAVATRVTNENYPGQSVPASLSPFVDSDNIWAFPSPISAGKLAGTQQGVLQIPKANPAKAQIFDSSANKLAAVMGSGTALYDGWRYGYVASSLGSQILQLDTQNPGTVNSVPSVGALPFYGMASDKNWAYATSFNGAAGLLLRFHPTTKSGN